ncbi:MAG: hypothetical protein ACMUIA_10180 [bacterium]
MPHIFFERLENRRSTQSLYGGYSPSGSGGVLYYGVLPPSNDTQTRYGIPVTYYGLGNPYPSPFPSQGSLFPSWGSGWGFYPYMPYNPWSNPFSFRSNPFISWSNPFSALWGGIGSIFSPFRNLFGGFYRWQKPTSPIFPGDNFPGEIHLLYGIPANPPTLPTGSYSPPDTTAILPFPVRDWTF